MIAIRRVVCAAALAALSLVPVRSAAAQPFGMITQELNAVEADAVQRSGAGWVLLNFNWDWVDRACTSAAALPGCRDYASLTAMVNDANAHGLQVLADLSYTAAWANGTGLKQSPPLNMQDYSNYVADIVSRFAPLGVKAWKVWNEPNIPSFMAPSGGDWVTQYGAYLTRARDAIKRADPNSRVVAPDLSYHALKANRRSEFTRIMATYSSAIDIVSVHHYDDDGVPLGVRLDEGVRPFSGGKPVWITETGRKWSSEGETLASQQEYYLRALADYDARRSWVSNIFFYQLVGPDLFNVTGNGSYESGFPALRSYEHWIKLGPAAAFQLAGIPPQVPSGVVDASKWTIAVASGTQDKTVPVKQYGTQIHVGPLREQTLGSHYNGVVSNETFDLTGGTAAVEIVAAPYGLTGAQAMLTLVADASNHYRIYLQGGQIYFEKKVGGVKSMLGNIVYSPNEIAHIGMTHVPGTDQIVFLTANARGVQRPRAATPRQIPIGALRYELKAGTSNTESAAPGYAVFDRVIVPTGSQPPGPEVLLADDFQVNAIDSAKWQAALISSARDPLVPMRQDGGRLAVGPLMKGAAGSHYNGVVSQRAYDLTGASASVRLAQSAAASTNGQAMLTAAVDGSNHYRIYVQNGKLSFEQKIGGVKTLVRTLPFSAAQHVYLRIAHDATADRIVFQTAAGDGMSWTTQAAVGRTLNVTALRMELKAGTSQVEITDPGTVSFDDFMLSRP